MTTVYLYSHTHWDREWYQPFEVFRLHLVSVVKRIVQDLEQGTLSRFYLDGQAVVLEDVLELEPSLAPRITALMQQGELAAGPWYVLPDQMLVAGESLIRNLKLGIATVKPFGTPALTGYSPDTFGHSQDLPRILNGFGIHSAFVWRGVPQLPRGPLFWWESPDGSRVLAWHFSRGYYQTLLHEVQGDAASRAVQASEQLLPLVSTKEPADGTSSLYSDLIEGALFPCGADHTAPPADMTALIEAMNAIDGLNVKQIQLVDFAEEVRARVTAKPTVISLISRELRDNCATKLYCNAFLLPGVLSTRLYLKRENRIAEYRLARFAEPLLAILHSVNYLEYPSAALTYAWKLLLQNHPHDSICGCSVDSAHDEMVNRSAKLAQILEALSDKACAAISDVDESSPLAPNDPDRVPNCIVVANPSGRVCSAPVPFTYFAPAGAQITFPSDSVQLRSMESSEELFSGWGRIPYYKFADKYQGWCWLENIPALGIKSQPWLHDGSASSRDKSKESDSAQVTTKTRSIDNGLMRVSINAKGLIRVMLRGETDEPRNFSLGHFISDVGDGGDTYNFDPLENEHPIMAELKSVEIGAGGPLVGSLILGYEIKIPDGCVEHKSKDGQISFRRSSRKITHHIKTELTLKRGGRLLYFDTSWTNASKDHRLEILFNTGNAIKTTYSENHFSLVKRIHGPSHGKAAQEQLPVARGYEALPDKFPNQRFVLANGQIFLNQGLPEYGVEGQELSLTLLRSVGILSRGPLRTRGGGAGPHVVTPGAQCLGLNRASYAWAPLPVPSKGKKELFDRIPDEIMSEAYDLAEEYEAEFLVGFSSTNEQKNNNVDWSADSLFQTENPCVRVVALYCAEDAGIQNMYLRLLNISENAQFTKIFIGPKNLIARVCALNEDGLSTLPLYREPSGKNYVELAFTRNQLHTIKLSQT